MFGEEDLSIPESQRLRKNDIFPTDLEILKEAASKLTSRLGDGMEDVSFREFVDLLQVTSGDVTASATAKSAFPIDMYILIERDLAPENRSSSVLRNLYLCSLNSVHKNKDSPTKDDPAMLPSIMLAGESTDESGFPVTSPTVQNICFEHCEAADRFYSDHPPPMGPLSRASTTESSCSESSLWSTVSFSKCTVDDNNDKKNSSSNDDNAVDFIPKWPSEINPLQESTFDQKEQLITISVPPETERTLSKPSSINELAVTNPSSSFHFVSIDDDDSDETIDDDDYEEEEDGTEANNSITEGCSSTDSSMIVFAEGEEEIQDHGPKNSSTATHTDIGSSDQAKNSPSRTGISEHRKVELPHNFEVIAIDASSDSCWPANRSRTFSVTTTASANSAEQSSPSQRAIRSTGRSRHFSDPNPLARPGQNDSFTLATEPTDGSLGNKTTRRNRFSDGSVVSLSDRFRKMIKMRPKSMASF